MKPIETELLSSAEGRLFVSYLPMPFRTGARLVVRNESEKPLNLIFFDIDHRRLKSPPTDAMYFHAFWSRERATKLGENGLARIAPAAERIAGIRRPPLKTGATQAYTPPTP